jgi:hypothetical protein
VTMQGGETIFWITALSLSFFLVMSGEGAALVAGLKRLCAAVRLGLRPSLTTSKPPSDLSHVDRSLAYRVIVTLVYEYHLLDQVCAGVRDRGTGRWLLAHAALGCRFGGSVMLAAGRQVLLPGAPRVGEATWFNAEKGDCVRTDLVLGVESPARISQQLLLRAGSRAAERERAGAAAGAQPQRAPGNQPAAGRAAARATLVLRRRPGPVGAVPVPSAAL